MCLSSPGYSSHVAVISLKQLLRRESHEYPDEEAEARRAKIDIYAVGDRIVIGPVSSWFQSSSFSPRPAFFVQPDPKKRVPPPAYSRASGWFSQKPEAARLAVLPSLSLCCWNLRSLSSTLGLPQEWWVGLSLWKMELNQMTSHPPYPGAYVLPRQGGDRQPPSSARESRDTSQVPGPLALHSAEETGFDHVS